MGSTDTQPAPPAIRDITHSTLSAQHAADLADWYCRFAIDRIGSDGRYYDPRFKSRLCAAAAQLAPAVRLGDPGMDQRVEHAGP